MPDKSACPLLSRVRGATDPLLHRMVRIRPNYAYSFINLMTRPGMSRIRGRQRLIVLWGLWPTKPHVEIIAIALIVRTG